MRFNSVIVNGISFLLKLNVHIDGNITNCKSKRKWCIRSSLNTIAALLC